MDGSTSIVFIIDDDAALREALTEVVRSVGLRAEALASAAEFLQLRRADVPSCLVLDVRLPASSGLDLQRQLADAKDRIPIIFITGYGDIPMSVQAMKAGAVEFLTKPFRNQEILDAIHQGLQRDTERRRREAEVSGLRKRLDSLTRREREVFPLVISGLANKQVASEIGISVAAAKVHRSQLMRKLGADSVARLVQMALKLGIPSQAA